MLAADRRVLCGQLWLREKPHYGMHHMVWDMVCLAAIHAMNVGRQAAWSVADRVESPELVANVVKRIVKLLSGMCWHILLCLLWRRCQLVLGCLLTNLSWLGQWWLCVAAACVWCGTDCLVHVHVCACFVLCTGLLHPVCMCALLRYDLHCYRCDIDQLSGSFHTDCWVIWLSALSHGSSFLD
jgi:hypothetical protein